MGFNASKGFTLIEIAIVIIVSSVMVAGGLSLYKVQLKKANIGTTKQRLADVSAAMARYQAKGSHLPCPAPMDAPPGSATFGKSDTENCSTASVQAGTTRVNGTGGNKVRIGAVPVVALGLPLEDFVDKWGNRLVYAVTEKMADAGVAYDENNGAITLLGDGTTVLGPVPNKTPFVIMSMGQSGAGAVSYEGRPTPVLCPATGPGHDNCDNVDAVFRAGSFSSSLTETDNFESIVVNSLIAGSNVASICGDLGLVYGPKHPKADMNGCVPKLSESANGTVGIGIVNPVSGAVLEVAGEVKIGNTALACAAGTAGAMRYNAGAVEFCNGTAWSKLDGPVGPTGDMGPQGAKGPLGPKGDTGPKGDPAGSCATGSCTKPWGGAMASGTSVTAYQAVSVTCGNTCTSETRNCAAGVLSGTYANQNCTVDACGSCAKPWGGTLASGSSVLAYQAASVPYGSSCVNENRTCTNGTLSGTYTNQNCSVAGGASCALPWGGTLASGTSVDAYLTSSVTCGNTCTKQSRTCTNGTLSGTYTNQNCSVDACPSCGDSICNGTENCSTCSGDCGACKCTEHCPYGTMYPLTCVDDCVNFCYIDGGTPTCCPFASRPLAGGTCDDS